MRLIVVILALMIPLALAPEAAAYVQRPKVSPPKLRPAGGQRGRAKAPPRRTNQRNSPAPRISNSALERWRRLTPRQRNKALQNLPPERRRALQQRLNRLDGLSPQQKQKLGRDYQQFQRMSPQQQSSYRGLYERFNKLPANRRPTVMQEYRQLRKLSANELERRIESKEFQKKFKAGERKLLTDMSERMPSAEK